MNNIVKKRNTLIGIFIVTIALILIIVAVGCSANRQNFDVNGQTGNDSLKGSFLNSTEDINNLVTDDDKLVINYFGAYTWVVFYNEYELTEDMIYIYEFDDEKTASEMLEVRKKELEQNRTMTVMNCRAIGNYVVVDLCDTSFHNISRNMLEKNFDGLVVY